MLGGLAAYVRDCRIPLEMCPSSNIQTGAADSVAAHPITLLKDLRFRVTVNTDNRLMSGTSMTREMQLLVDEAGWTLDDLRWATINAMKSAFLPFDERLEIIEHVVKPGLRRPRRRQLTGPTPGVGRSRVSGKRVAARRGGERVGRQDPRAQPLLAPQPVEVATPTLGDDGREHDLGVEPARRRRADVRQGRVQQLDPEGAA